MKKRISVTAFAVALGIVSILVMAPLAFANDVYIAQAATGSANGSSCANAYAASYFNTSGNWTSGTPSGTQIGPGSTVHICGTITVAAGATALTFRGSGSSGNPITLKWESGAVVESPAFSPNGGVIANQDYTTIDGGTNGILQNTANGTGLAYNQASGGVGVSGSNITVKNLTVRNICQRSAGDPSSDECTTGGSPSGGIGCSGGCTNVTFTKNTVSLAGNACLAYGSSGGDSNVTFSFNTVTGCNWGIMEYPFSSGTSSGFYILGNDVSCTVGGACAWDDPSDSAHHNGIMIFPQSGDYMQNVVIANNYVHDIQSSTNSLICGGGGGCVTALVFIDPAGGNNLPGIQYYNNLLVSNPPPGTSGPSNAILQSAFHTGAFDGTPNAIIVNNTIIGPAQWGTGCDDACIIKNNIVINGMVYNYGFDSVISPNSVDYNDLYGATSAIASGYSTLSSWQSGSGSVCSGGCDAHSISADPQLNSDYTPQSSSPVIGKGTNLTSLGISGLNQGPPQYFGANYACGSGCVSRPSSGAWDIGAYPSSSRTSSGSKPAPPTGLTGTVQ